MRFTNNNRTICPSARFAYGQGIIEIVAVTVAILVPLTFAMLDLTTLILCIRTNDDLAKSSARAAARFIAPPPPADPSDPTQAPTGPTTATEAAQAIVTSFAHRTATGTDGNRIVKSVNPQITMLDDLAGAKAVQVNTEMRITLPAPLLVVPTDITLFAQSTERVTSTTR